MLKKISITLLFLLLSSTIHAEEQNTIEDKYAACEKLYDTCLLKCEENENPSVCMEKCDEELYLCNEKVIQLESK